MTTRFQLRRNHESKLRKQYGVRPYKLPARCPECGTTNVMRRKDAVCFACVIKERANAA